MLGERNGGLKSGINWMFINHDMLVSSGQNNQPLAPSPQQQNPSDEKMHDGGELQRIDILKRLDFAMQRNPTFEQRVQTMLRVWSEDSAAAPPLQTIGQ